MNAKKKSAEKPASSAQEEGKKRAKSIMMIYDAPAGPIAAMVDSAKKVFGLGCTLCTITHGISGKRKTWEQFEKKSGLQIMYLHKDEIGEIEGKLGIKLTLPCVLVELEDGDLQVLLSHITIRNLENPSVDGLIEAFELWAGAMDIQLYDRQK